MIVALAAGAALSSATLSFAPPVGQPLRYETIERRSRPDGTMRGAALAQNVVFAADTDGYVMTIDTVGYRALIPAGESDPFEPLLKPMVGGSLKVHVSRAGVPERVIGGAASWARMLAALRTEVAAHAPGDPGLAPARTMLAALEATPPQARDAKLLQAADDVLGTRLPPLAIGAETHEDGSTISRTADTETGAQYRERTMHVAMGLSLETDTTIAISHVTGLVVHSLRKTVVAGRGTARPISECEVSIIP